VGKHGEMMEWYRTLIHLRRSSASLNDGDLGHIKIAVDEAGRWLRMDRDLVTTICNLGDAPLELASRERSRLLLSSKAGVTLGETTVTVPPGGFVLLSAEEA
jgi:maltooligosyltrehalose trehalohydrolase